MKRLCFLVLLAGAVTFGNGQNSVNDYSYVVVPELYEFLNERDQFQLNSLTKFLFNKHGFNAYFGSELPNVKRCDGLYADVEGKSGFIYTRLTVVLKDCYGNEVYRSEEGTSKLKEFRRAFQQSLRNAFESVEALGAKQKEIRAFTEVELDENKTEVPVINEMRPPPKNDGAASGITAGTGNKISTRPPLTELPEEKFSSYTMDGKNFLLRRTTSGYSLYEETEDSETGLVLRGKLTTENQNVVYTTTDGAIYRVQSGDSGALVITNGEMTMVYKPSDQ